MLFSGLRPLKTNYPYRFVDLKLFKDSCLQFECSLLLIVFIILEPHLYKDIKMERVSTIERFAKC